LDERFTEDEEKETAEHLFIEPRQRTGRPRRRAKPQVSTYCIQSCPVLWICICFYAVPDPDFYLRGYRSGSRDPDECVSGSGSWSDFKVTKVEFLHEEYTGSSNR
jgi:hypothetical protein